MIDPLPGITARIRSVIRLVTNIGLIKTTITYYRHTGDEYSRELGRNVTSFDEYPDVPCAAVPHGVDSAAALRGVGVEVGDLMYLIDKADLPFDAAYKDEILDQSRGVRMKISHYQPLANVAMVITCRTNP